MTGEMSWIDEKGNDSNGDCYELHAKVAEAIGGKLRPFDVYQGPYIVVGEDYTMGQRPYKLPCIGSIRLWLLGEEGFFTWYREDTETESNVFWEKDIVEAIEAAKTLLK